MNVDDLVGTLNKYRPAGRSIRQVRFRSRADALRLLGEDDPPGPPPWLPEPSDPRPERPGLNLTHIPVVWDPDLGPDEIRLDYYPETAT